MRNKVIVAIIMFTLSLMAMGQTSNPPYLQNTKKKFNPSHMGRIGNNDTEMYYGLRIGAAFTSLHSDVENLDANTSKTGLNIGAVVGFALSDLSPIYLETGLYYTEKGGKMGTGDTRKLYNLDYLLLPITAKYIIETDYDIDIHPYAGGYLAVGIAGEIKDYAIRESQTSYSSSAFQRFDAGIRLGCGVSYELFYAEASFDVGLANISNDSFDKARTTAFMLTAGINF